MTAAENMFRYLRIGNETMYYSFLYLFSIVMGNVAFDYIPLVLLPSGDLWPPASLLVGFIFVIRDYTQREVGHRILFLMVIGAVLSGVLTSPALALASVCAFLIGEIFDWGVYSFTKKPFAQRILLSSAVSTPIDSGVFLLMMDIFSIPSLLVMTVSKMIGAFIVYYIADARERTEAQMEKA